MTKQELIDFLKQELRIDVKTNSQYIGDMHGGESLYQDSHEISLILDDEVISSISI